MTAPAPAPTDEPSALDAALGYATRGWHVLPIRKGEKRPPMESWQHAATDDPDKIRNWYGGLYRECGVGIATGHRSGIFVLDVDVSDGKHGDDTLAELVAEHGPLPDTVRAITGSGGGHIYFNLPPGVDIRNNASTRLGPGLDIRGEGGQVVAAPTVHPNGKRYEWETDCSPDDLQVADAPVWLLERLVIAPVAERKPTASHVTVAGIVTDVDDSIAARIAADHDWHSLLYADGWHQHSVTSSGDTMWTRPGKEVRDGASAVLHEPDGPLVVFSTDPVLAKLHRPEASNRGNNGYSWSLFGYLAATRFDGDRSACARAYRQDLNAQQIQAVTADRGATAHAALTGTDVADDVDDPWPEAIPLGQTLTTPAFPLDTLPEWIRNHAADVANELQVAVDLPALLALSALGVAQAGHVVVHVKNTWRENVNLYIAVALPPGAGKSPAVRAMTHPIDMAERDARLDVESRIKYVELERTVIEGKKKKAEAAGDLATARGHLAELESDSLRVPVVPRYVADDATPEKLAQMMCEQGGRMALISTEGGPFEMMTGRYSERSNLEVYLQAWSGDTIRIDRVSRDSLHIANPVLSVCLTVQPSVISALADRPELAGRGLTARFMYAVPRDFVGHRDLLSEQDSNPAHVHAYETRLAALMRHGRPEYPTVLAMTTEARRMFLEWRQDLERQRTPDGALRPLAEWTTKLESSVVRVAGLLAIADDATEIDADIMARALRIGAYWLDHARIVHDLWGADEQISTARYVLEWLRQREVQKFTVRDLYRGLNGKFKQAADTVPILHILTERGWVRPLFDGPITVGARGRPSPEFAVRPSNLWISGSHVIHVIHGTRSDLQILTHSLSTDEDSGPTAMTAMNDNSTDGVSTTDDGAHHAPSQNVTTIDLADFDF
jgi:replicative DNA helicase